VDRGLLTPQRMLADVPSLYRDYKPENFDGGHRGLVSAREALVLSLNLPALDVEQRIGQPVFYDTLRALGLDTLGRPASHYGLGLVLGNGEVRLLDVVNAYACLARGGEARPVRVLEDAEWSAGRHDFLARGRLADHRHPERRGAGHGHHRPCRGCSVAAAGLEDRHLGGVP
jgi:membrane carboxypeptidase/penicillin-binding protein PbpC